MSTVRVSRTTGKRSGYYVVVWSYQERGDASFGAVIIGPNLLLQNSGCCKEEDYS